MTSGAPSPSGYRPQLDALRAFAVLGVVLSHTSPRYQILQFTRPGDRGVQLFFVLSGFLISRILFDAISERGFGALKPFYARRALRLLPLFYVVLAITALVAWQELHRSWPFHAFYLSNYWFLADGGWEWSTSHFWSLAIEEQFYFIWPLALVVIRPRYWRAAVVGLIALGLGTRLLIELTDRWHEFGSGLYTSYYADGFGIGAALALWLRTNPTASAVRRLAIAAGISGMAVLIALGFFLGAFRAANSTLDVTAWGLISISAVACCFQGIGGPIGRLLESPPLLGLGRISYGIYAWHVLAIALTLQLIKLLGLNGLLGRFDWIMTFAGGALLSVMFALASWHLMESKLLKLKSRFPYSTT